MDPFAADITMVVFGPPPFLGFTSPLEPPPQDRPGIIDNLPFFVDRLDPDSLARVRALELIAGPEAFDDQPRDLSITQALGTTRLSAQETANDLRDILLNAGFRERAASVLS
jgi:hypothetical protein